MLKGLYLITDPCWKDDLLNKVESALSGGCRLVQYRNKGAAQSLRKTEALAVQALCETYNASFLINDDIELAVAIGADGVHLGQDDSHCLIARQQLGSEAIIGITCHSDLRLAKNAECDGANYVAFGRFFPSSTKPEAVPAPQQLITEAKQSLAIPVVAIGGITLDNAPNLIQQGVDMLAVSHSLLSADNCEQRARAFNELFRR